jgi:hypothetical protein
MNQQFSVATSLLIKGFEYRLGTYYSKDSKYSWTSIDNDPDIYWNLRIVKNDYAEDMLFKIEDEQTLDTILISVGYEITSD